MPNGAAAGWGKVCRGGGIGAGIGGGGGSGVAAGCAKVPEGCCEYGNVDDGVGGT